MLLKILIHEYITGGDIIPIINGKVICEERTDTGRLINNGNNPVQLTDLFGTDSIADY